MMKYRLTVVAVVFSPSNGTLCIEILPPSAWRVDKTFLGEGSKYLSYLRA